MLCKVAKKLHKHKEVFMDPFNMSDLRKNIIDLKLKLDMVEEITSQAMDAIYKMEERMMEQEEMDYSKKYSFLAGVN